MLQLVIADDHAIFRAGLRSLVEACAGVEVIAEAANGAEAIDLTLAKQPHVVLMDIMMPEVTGIEATERIRKEAPHVKVIILSIMGDEHCVAGALRAGASAYLLKNSLPYEINLALQKVMANETYITPSLMEMIAKTDAPSILTPQQREIVRMFANGMNAKEIAGAMNLDHKTIEWHRRRIMQRLCVRDIAALVRYAIRAGLVSLE